MGDFGDDRREAARFATIEAFNLDKDQSDRGFDAVVQLVTRSLAADFGAFTILHQQDQLILASHGENLSRMPRQESFCQIALAADADLLCIADAAVDPRSESLPLVTGTAGVRFYAGAAVRAPNGLVVGSICVLGREPRKLDDGERQLLLDGRELLESLLLLRDAALRDPLTGLFNRRYFDERFDREIRRAYRHLAPITLFLLDIDNFKAYNDILGQKKADETLCAVAQALQEAVRRGGDLVARYSGDQFVVVLPDTNAGYADLLAERLRRAVTDLAIDHPASPSRRVSISCGGAVAQQTRDLAAGSNLVLAVASQALFQARERGENEMVVQTIAEAFGRNNPEII